VRGIEEVYGPKKDLILLDNNVLASRKFERIIHDLIDLGFQKGAMYGVPVRPTPSFRGLEEGDNAAMRLKGVNRWQQTSSISL
jgi:hypothetical protein